MEIRPVAVQILPSGLHCHPQSLLGLLKININMTKNLNRINRCGFFFVMEIYSVFYNSLCFFSAAVSFPANCLNCELHLLMNGETRLNGSARIWWMSQDVFPLWCLNKQLMLLCNARRQLKTVSFFLIRLDAFMQSSSVVKDTVGAN